MDSIEIRRIVKEIRDSKKSHQTVFFEDKYPEFIEKYPKLFELCCDRNASLETLYYMIDMLEKIQKNQMTEHVASVSVGQKLFDSYVKPVVGEDAIAGTGPPIGNS
jgi:hypothetical protein